MNSTDFNRLVDLYEQQMLSLLSGGVSLKIQVAAYQEALIRVARSLSTHVPGIFPYPSLLPLPQKKNGKDAGEIDRKLPEASQALKRKRPRKLKAPMQLALANRPAGKRIDKLTPAVKATERSKGPANSGSGAQLFLVPSPGRQPRR